MKKLIVIAIILTTSFLIQDNVTTEVKNVELNSKGYTLTCNVNTVFSFDRISNQKYVVQYEDNDFIGYIKGDGDCSISK